MAGFTPARLQTRHVWSQHKDTLEREGERERGREREEERVREREREEEIVKSLNRMESTWR